MEPGYSRLLINDNILSSKSPDLQVVTVDLIMMVKVAAGERTDVMTYHLLKSVGFKVVKMWTAPGAVTSIIEAEVSP